MKTVDDVTTAYVLECRASVHYLVVVCRIVIVRNSDFGIIAKNVFNGNCQCRLGVRQTIQHVYIN